MIGELLSALPALKATERLWLPTVTEEIVGAPGAAAGTTLTRGLDSTDSPIPLAAVTLT